MTPQIEQHLTANGNLKKRHIMVNNFLGGLAWGFGTVIGATIVVALLFSILQIFNFIPGIKDLEDQYNQNRVIRQIEQK